MRENTRFVQMVGGGVLRLWPDLPREIQERLFEETVGDDEALRHALALYLHDHHHGLEAPPPLTRVPCRNLLIWLALFRHGHHCCKVRIACEEETRIACRKIVRQEA